MQANLRVEKVMRSNFKDFAIFEYSRLITPQENFMSVHSLQRDQKSDTMIPIPETVESVLSVKVSGNNRIMCLERLKVASHVSGQAELELVKFEEGDRRCIRMPFRAINLVSANVCGDYILYAMESQDCVQMQLVDCTAMRVKATGFLGDRVKGIELIGFGESIAISVLCYSGEIKLFHYHDQQKSNPSSPTPSSPASFSPTAFLSGRSLPGFDESLRHRYVNSQFMVCSQASSISMYMDYSKYQHVTFKDCVSAIQTNSFGVFVFTVNRLMYFRQKRENFEMEIDLHVGEIEVCRRMEISPSDALVLLWAQDLSMVSVWINNEENNRSLNNEDLVIQVQRTQPKQLVCLASSLTTSLIATIQKSPYTLCLYDLQSQGQPFMTYQLTAQQQSVSDCCFHPLVPMLVVSYRNQVKIYFILYSELKEVRQLPVVRCKKIVYSNNGGLLACVVGKDKGTKLVLYEMRDYNVIETLWVGGNPKEVFWSTYDNMLFVVAENGFFSWSVEDNFKERHEVNCPEEAGRLIGGFYDKLTRSAVAVAQNLMIRVGRDNTVDIIKSYPQLSQILQFSNGYIMNLTNGTLLWGPTLEVGAVSHHRLSLFRKPSTLSRCNFNRLVCTSSQGEILVVCDREGRDSKVNQFQIVLADKHLITETMTQLRNYEKDMRLMSVKLEGTVEELKKEFAEQQRKLELKFSQQMREAQDREQSEREQKHLLQKYLRDNGQMYQKQQFKAVAELQKLYQRKIILTTNKLLTSQQIAVRNQVTAEKHLKSLAAIHDSNILMIRDAYFEQAKLLNDSQQKQHDAGLKIHKEYQQRIAQIESEYETMMRDIQVECEAMLREEKRMNVIWESRYSTCQSEKQNLQQAIKSLKDDNKELLIQQQKKENTNMLMERKVALVKRDGDELQTVIKALEDKIAEYEYKVKDLEKAKEILTFRVLQTRNLLIPKEQQLSDFQMQFCHLEEEFDKTLAESQENIQKVQRLKKDLELCKKELNASKSKQKASKGQMQGLVNKIYEIVNHSSPEEWNRSFLKLYEQYCRDVQHKQSFKYRSKNTVEELNRVRVHLQHCLDQVITSNVKIAERKTHEFTRKTQQNAQLLRDINDLRRNLKELKDVLDQKNLEIERMRAQKMQSELNDQRRIKTEGGDQLNHQRRRSKFSETRSRTFYQSDQQQNSSSGFTKFLESSQSKRVTSAQKGAVRRGKNFSKCFRIDTELNRKYEQEDELKEARRQLQLQEQLIIELKSRFNSR